MSAYERRVDLLLPEFGKALDEALLMLDSAPLTIWKVKRVASYAIATERINAPPPPDGQEWERIVRITVLRKHRTLLKSDNLCRVVRKAAFFALGYNHAAVSVVRENRATPSFTVDRRSLHSAVVRVTPFPAGFVE